MNYIGNKQYKDIDSFIDVLKEQMKSPMPGKAAQLRMASAVRNKELNFNYDTSTAIQSSVLILLFPVSGQLHTVFILRQTYDGVHSGQVSFPGGRLESSDSSLIQTALREAEEEVNISAGEVTVLGTLSELYIPPSNFLVLPVLGYVKNRPEFKPDPSEVAQIIEADISFLFDDMLLKSKVLDIRGSKIKAPYFDVHDHIVWGATAMILSELKDVILSIGSLNKKGHNN
jgi:8-oxo-dGTP pyrophosphatase MutT (NUDIX family)